FVLGENALDALALLRVAGDDVLVQQGALAVVEPQFRLAIFFILPVTLQTMLRQDGANLKIVADLFACPSWRGDEQDGPCSPEHEFEKKAKHQDEATAVKMMSQNSPGTPLHKPEPQATSHDQDAVPHRNLPDSLIPNFMTGSREAPAQNPHARSASPRPQT